jgi:hypothetical protein
MGGGSDIPGSVSVSIVHDALPDTVVLILLIIDGRYELD